MPLKIRLSLLVATVTFFIMLIGGIALRATLAAGIAGTMHDALRRTAGRVIADLTAGRLPLSTGKAAGQTKNDQSVIQIIGSSGVLILTTETAGSQVLLTSSQISQALKGPIFTQAKRASWTTPYLLLAEPVSTVPSRVVLVGAALDEYQNALSGLQRNLIIGGTILVLISTIGGYFLARRALAPVDRFCLQAEEFSAGMTGRRLEVTKNRDELEHLAQTLNGMLDRIEASMAQQRRFVAAASHELRTPLATIQAEIDVARLSEEVGSQLAVSFEIISQRVSQLSRLSGDLLLLATGDEGKLRLNPHRQLIGPTIAECLQALTAKASNLSVKLVLRCQDGASAIVDTTAFRHILENLVNNALQHGGGKTTVVEVAFHTDAQWSILTVADDGPGMPADFLPHAFEYFNRAPKSRTPGSGLGLSVVSMLVHAHRGRVTVENRNGGGTRVTVWFPAYPTPTMSASQSDVNTTLMSDEQGEKVSPTLMPTPKSKPI